MKLNFKAILFAALAAFMSASCEEGILDRSPKLEDVPAEKVELADVLFSDGERVTPYYVYSVKLGTSGATEASGVVLDAKFVSNEPALHAATYAPAAAGSERRNTYITGENGTKLIINGEAHQVVAGNIVIGLADGTYTLSGVVDLDNDARYELNWAGAALEFGELPVLTKLPTLLSAQSNVMMGTKTVTVKLGTEGLTSEFDETTFQNVIKGTGAYLAVDFYSEDGYLAAGTYKPCADFSNPQPGEYVVGYDTTVDWGWGPMEFKDWGTCWWTVKDGLTVDAEGKNTAEKITTGDIYVEMSEDKIYTISIDNAERILEFSGAIPALTKPDKPQGGGDTGSSVEEYPVLLSAQDQFEQYGQVVLQFASNDAITLEDPATATYSGTGKVFMLTINAAKDENGGLYIPTGEYAVDPQGASQPFTWQATGGIPGWIDWGSLIYDVVDGNKTLIELKEGTVWVGAKGGEYIINLESGDMKIRYTGAIEGLATPADDDGGYVGEDAGDDVLLEGDVVIKITEGLTSKMEDDTANNKTADQSDLSGVSLYYFEVNDASGDIVAIFDFVTEEGATSVAGEYTITSYPDEVGEAGNGFDFFGFSGGSILYDGDESYNLDSGTIKVTEKGDKITIVVNAKSGEKTIAAQYVIG